MKSFCRISFIFILSVMSCIMLILFAYFTFMPVPELKKKVDMEEAAPLPVQESADVVINTEERTDCDTQYIVLLEDLSSGEHTSVIDLLPSQYIGKTREEVEQILDVSE